MDVRAAIAVAADRPLEISTVRLERPREGEVLVEIKATGVCTDVPRIVDWYMQGKIEIDPMITHVMPLAEINTAFELMKRGESIRGVVTF